MILERDVVTFAVFVFTFLIVIPSTAAFGQQPLMTFPLIKDSDSQTTIDGKWTTADEWTKASEMFVNYTDGTQLIVRGKHDSNSLFIMLEMPLDYVLDGRGAVCFDTLNDGGPYLEPDDYCFVLSDVGLREYKGDGRTTLMQQTSLGANVFAQSGLSNGNSPYKSDRSHVMYEFKIPFQELGARTNWGFYVTYETRGQTNNYTYYYSWPDYKNAASLRVASPRDWGHLEVSSQSVVPEFTVQQLGTVGAALAISAIVMRIGFFKSHRI